MSRITSIDHFNINRISNSGMNDRVVIKSVTESNDNYVFNLEIQNISQELRSYLISHNNRTSLVFCEYHYWHYDKYVKFARYANGDGDRRSRKDYQSIKLEYFTVNITGNTTATLNGITINKNNLKNNAYPIVCERDYSYYGWDYVYIRYWFAIWAKKDDQTKSFLPPNSDEFVVYYNYED